MPDIFVLGGRCVAIFDLDWHVDDWRFGENDRLNCLLLRNGRLVGDNNISFFSLLGNDDWLFRWLRDKGWLDRLFGLLNDDDQLLRELFGLLSDNVCGLCGCLDDVDGDVDGLCGCLNEVDRLCRHLNEVDGLCRCLNDVDGPSGWCRLFLSRLDGFLR